MRSMIRSAANILQGIFHNKDENVFVWINEEDHSRLISMEKGDDVKGIVSRFARLTEALQGIIFVEKSVIKSNFSCLEGRRP